MAQTKFIREAFHVSPEGNSCRQNIQVLLDKGGEVFYIEMPKYAADRVANGERVIGATSLRGAVEAYESAMEQYQRWRLKAKAQPMIMLMLDGKVEGGDQASVFSYAKLELIAEMVYVSEPLDGMSDVYARTGTTDNILDFGDMGEKIDLPNVNGGMIVFLPDNREVRAKVSQLCASVTTARSILMAVRDLPDEQKLAAFLNIGEAPADAERQPEVASKQQTLPPDDPNEVL